MYRSRIRAGLGVIILASLLLASCGLGNIAAYGAIVAALLIIVTWPKLSEWRTALSMPGNIALLLAFGALLVSGLANTGRGDGFGPALSFLPLILGVPAVIAFEALKGKNRIVLFGRLAFFGSLIGLAVVSYEAFILHNYRPSGLEFSPIHQAALVQILGFLALSVPLQEPHPKNAIYLLGPVIGLTDAILTGTRASLFVFIVLSALTLIFMLYRFRSKAFIFAAGIVLFLGLGLAFLNGTSVGTRALSGLYPVLDVLKGNSAADPSTAYRLDQYSAGIQALFDAPLFGHGWHNQIAAAMPYLSDFARAGYASEGWAYIHNEALNFTVSAGILGLFAYCLIFCGPILSAVHAPKDSQFLARTYAFFIIAAGIFAAGLTDVVMMVEMFKTIIAILPAALWAMCRDENGVEPVPNGGR